MISIHALREEGDIERKRGGQPGNKFLSTPSARRATDFESDACDSIVISIHALREEGDRFLLYVLSLGFLFLSTPSARRATGSCCTSCPWASYFYPRPPRGGRHRAAHPGLSREEISIHALREEGDLRTWQRRCKVVMISIHALREEGDTTLLRFVNSFFISIHALREEGDGLLVIRGGLVALFLSTPSARRATRNSSRAFAPTLFLSTPSARRATGSNGD